MTPVGYVLQTVAGCDLQPQAQQCGEGHRAQAQTGAASEGRGQTAQGNRRNLGNQGGIAARLHSV